MVVPHGNLIMSSTWIFDRRYGYYAARFGGTARLLQSYFAVAFIVIWLCMCNDMQRHTFVLRKYWKLTWVNDLKKNLKYVVKTWVKFETNSYSSENYSINKGSEPYDVWHILSIYNSSIPKWINGFVLQKPAQCSITILKCFPGDNLPMDFNRATVKKLENKRQQFWFCCHMLSDNCQARPYLE